jgi:hypothetical protein
MKASQPQLAGFRTIKNTTIAQWLSSSAIAEQSTHLLKKTILSNTIPIA